MNGLQSFCRRAVVRLVGAHLVVRPVDGVAALESHHVYPLGEVRAGLGGGLAEEVPLRPVQAGQLARHVVLAPVHRHHLHACVGGGIKG